VGSMDGMVCSPSSVFGLDGLVISLPFGCGCSRCFSFPTLSPLLSSFSSLPSLLSCLRAIVIPLFVLQCFGLILPLFCPLPVSYYAQFIAQSEWVLRLLPLTPIPPPPFPPCSPSTPLPPSSQIAELLHIVHTCLVPRCNMCIS